MSVLNGFGEKRVLGTIHSRFLLDLPGASGSPLGTSGEACSLSVLAPATSIVSLLEYQSSFRRGMVCMFPRVYPDLEMVLLVYMHRRCDPIPRNVY